VTSPCGHPPGGRRWDSLRLDQVLTNLLSNALRHGAGRPVEIVVDAVEDEAARLVVRDHGEGIPREQMPLLFGRFQRGRGRTGQGGLGLGLFISRHIVEAHGGPSGGERAGQGTTFTIELPPRPGERGVDLVGGGVAEHSDLPDVVTRDVDPSSTASIRSRS
jgi:signal transduction histidine kinase